MRHKSETSLAIATLVMTSMHFFLETWYHLVWGQPWHALAVDYISNALGVFGGVISLKVRPRSAAGLLAAAWAFALGFGWRSAFGRLDRFLANEATFGGEAGFVLPIICGSLLIVIGMLTWALWLTYRQSVRSHEPEDL